MSRRDRIDESSLNLNKPSEFLKIGKNKENVIKIKQTFKNAVVWSFFVFLIFLNLSCGRKAQNLGVEVRFDPRVELISILARLAGYAEYNQARIPSYANDADTHFGAFKDHDAVTWFRKLRETRSMAFNAPLSLSVYLTDAYTLKEKVPLDPIPEGLDNRWIPEEVRECLNAARRFVDETDFRAFIEGHRPLYDTTAQRIQKVLETQARLEWFDTFFGSRPQARYTVVPGLLTGPCSYGLHTKNQDGSEDLYSILAIPGVDEEGLPAFSLRSGQMAVELIVHEFSHSYINPLVDQHAEALEDAGQKIFAHVAQEMTDQAYGTWKTMMYESLVRTCEVRYLIDNGEKLAAMKKSYEEALLSFFWIEVLADLLGRYENHRDQYPDLNVFFPRIAAFFDEYALDAGNRIQRFNETWIAEAPKIVSMTPADGTQDVDPGLKSIQIRFDRPMHTSFSVTPTGQPFPRTTGKSVFDEGKKVFTLPVELEPDRKYGLQLNFKWDLGFMSEDGVPFIPLQVHFKTRRK